MRVLSVLSCIILLSILGFAQDGERGVPGYCAYGCGPYVPLISTPSLSFVNVSPNPVGATNATGGLIAGATNSTLSEVNGNTNPVYSVPVWYAGGGMPLVSSATNSAVGGMKMNAARAEFREHMEHAQREHEAGPQSWTYYASAEAGSNVLERAGGAARIKSAKRTFTNQDVDQQNQKNGYVHYDGKTEKIQ
jgi:hypothetical protein